LSNRQASFSRTHEVPSTPNGNQETKKSEKPKKIEFNVGGKPMNTFSTSIRVVLEFFRICLEEFYKVIE
jgi:hypothetical protein